MLPGMRPDHGGRVALRLTEAAQERVRYTADFATAEGEWRLEAQVRVDDGQVHLETPPDAAPPEWLRNMARTALRAAWRGRASAAAPWPRRITRWRAAP